MKWKSLLVSNSQISSMHGAETVWNEAEASAKFSASLTKESMAVTGTHHFPKKLRCFFCTILQSIEWRHFMSHTVAGSPFWEVSVAN
jgi:hypothetical protein